MLKISHLTKSFGNKNVLRDLDLEVKDGSIFGLVGINGAGKSTLLRLIAGVYEPEKGSIEFNGRNTWNDMEAKKQIAFVSDETWFPIAATIRSMKLMYEVLYNFDQDAYEKYLRIFELNPNQQISRFSKGMKRKTALLFALCIHPGLLLLDEAYDGLEPLTRFRFKGILTDLIEEEQLSVIIASHSLKELEDVCDSFGILNDGRIMDSGDLIDSKENINKYQIAFAKETIPDFSGIDVLHMEKEGQIYKLIIKGNRSDIEEKLQQMNPLLLNVLPVNFEELFIYEVEKKEKDNDQ